MKFLLFLVAVFVLLWLLRGSLRKRMPPPTPPAGTPLQDMVRCAQCGMHLPSGEALPGRGGVFCGEAHRLEFEKTHPGP